MENIDNIQCDDLCIHPVYYHRLAGVVPDALEETLLGGDAVDGLEAVSPDPIKCVLGTRINTHVVGLALRTDLAAESDGGALTLDGLSVGVNVGNGDLNRGVVLGGDQAVWSVSKVSWQYGARAEVENELEDTPRIEETQSKAELRWNTPADRRVTPYPLLSPSRRQNSLVAAQWRGM